MFGPRTLNRASDPSFDGVISLFASLASFCVAVESYLNSGHSTAPGNANHYCTMPGRVADVVFRTHGLLHTISRNTWPESIQIEVFPASATAKQGIRGIELQSQAIAEFVSRQLGNCFMHFFESNVDCVRTVYGEQPKDWPPDWRLAWMLRNAIAHGDRWTINDKAFPEGNWRCISVGPSDNGESWFNAGRYLGGGDLVLLMQDLKFNANPYDAP